MCICSPLDVQGRFRATKPAQALLRLIRDYSLVDVWRERHANTRRYTWRKTNPTQGSRIDYAFVSQSMIDSYMINRVEIKPCIHNDHSLVNIEMSMHLGDKGRGLFRFDNRLLDDQNFTQIVGQEINSANEGHGVYAGVSNLGLRIEILLSKIRVHSIKISKHKAQERRKEYDRLIGDVDDLEQEVSENPTDVNVERRRVLQERLDEMEEEKGRIAMIRSGARWLEEGEKPTKYFLRMCERRSKEKNIQVLQRPDGDYVTGNTEILDYCKGYFEEIYSSRGVTTDRSQVTSFLAPTVCPKLSEIDRQSCDGEISKEECELALRGMMNNKAPSVSGFSKEFFLHFWLELGDIVVNYINQAREQGVFFVTQRRGVLTLIPKKGDPKLIQNKRPICLLDVIYKIVAKVLANRMMSVIHTIVCPDQTGSIRGRYIGTNLRTIADVIYYASADRLDGIVMALDFRNAFNSVEHEFVYNVLKEIQFWRELHWVD